MLSNNAVSEAKEKVVKLEWVKKIHVGVYEMQRLPNVYLSASQLNSVQQSSKWGKILSIFLKG